MCCRQYHPDWPLVPGRTSQPARRLFQRVYGLCTRHPCSFSALALLVVRAGCDFGVVPTFQGPRSPWYFLMPAQSVSAMPSSLLAVLSLPASSSPAGGPPNGVGTALRDIGAGPFLLPAPPDLRPCPTSLPALCMSGVFSLV